MAKINLKNIQFVAYHGFYPEENICGGKFETDLSVEFNLQDQLNDDLDKTINYEALYDIAKKHMSIPKSLIETPAMNILRDITTTWPFVSDCRVAVRKLSPIIPGNAEYSEIIVTKADIHII